MTLPLSRNKTYALGDPVRGADMNDLQDQVIAIVGGTVALKRTSRIRYISPASGAIITGGGAASLLVSGRWQTTAATTIVFPVTVDQGERILGAGALTDPGAGVSTLELFRVNSAAVAASIASVATVGTALQTIAFSGLTELITATPVSYTLAYTTPNTGDTIQSLWVVTDVP